MRIFTPDVDEEGRHNCLELHRLKPYVVATPSSIEDVAMGAITIVVHAMHSGEWDNGRYGLVIASYEGSDTFYAMDTAELGDEDRMREVHRFVRHEGSRTEGGKPIFYMAYATLDDERMVNLFVLGREEILAVSMNVNPLTKDFGKVITMDLQNPDFEGQEKDVTDSALRVREALLSFRSDVFS